MKADILFRLLFIHTLFFIFNLNIAYADNISSELTKYYNEIFVEHPRMFITNNNRNIIKSKAEHELADAYRLLTTRHMKHSRIPNRLLALKNYIYKYGYLYQMTRDEQWCELVVAAMDNAPNAIQAHGGANNGFAHALEGLSIGFDWCYDTIVRSGRTQHFVKLINLYYQGNQDNLWAGLPDFHNYASQAQFAMLAAGIATYGDNPSAIDHLEEALDVMERGVTRDGVYYNVADSVAYVDGTCSWEGVMYARQQIFSYGKYAEAWRTATNGKINPWEGTFSNLENAGYYIMYNTRPDNIYENIGDVNYPGISFHDVNNMALLQNSFKNPYFTTFLNRHYRWDNGTFDTDIWLGRGGLRSPLVYYLMWYDPTVPEASLDELPRSKRFGDQIVIRTGFEEDDTLISFKSGIHWGFHSQLDHGSFTIFKHRPLAIDSGYYDNWRWGRRMNWNYWKRTTAHNTLLIDHPQEKSVRWPRNNLLHVDGGQRLAWVTFSPPHSSSGSHNKPFSIADLKNRIDEFEMGIITNYESTDEYDYIRTDLTNAYSNKYSGRGNNQPKKVHLVERSFVYLPPDVVTIFDRIDVPEKHFTKKWLLHSGSYYDKSGRPELNGDFMVVQGASDAGIVESSDTDLIKITQGEGRLFVKTLLPEQGIIRRIGGEGYEFWLNGANRRFAQEEIPRARRNEDPGAWRIEIQPRSPNTYDEFLTVLFPTNSSVDSIPATLKIETVSASMVGARVIDARKNWLILFHRSDIEPSKTIEYSVENAKGIRQLLFNVKPNTYFQVSQSVSEDMLNVLVQESRDEFGILSSPEGVLLF
ncbi:heparinase II/III domain-containing protein [Desulfonatronum lacustre]|uniref:heparinase II/III domain-containing protein n=1 Tax=Desulfonatronum lacustre TaxID=66849 RepID=UPI00048F7A5D|nr:heparinase II/III family protein [Desulfonatronum lacustre]